MGKASVRPRIRFFGAGSSDAPTGFEFREGNAGTGLRAIAKTRGSPNSFPDGSTPIARRA